jgi:hypothetical protein
LQIAGQELGQEGLEWLNAEQGEVVSRKAEKWLLRDLGMRRTLENGGIERMHVFVITLARNVFSGAAIQYDSCTYLIKKS